MDQIPGFNIPHRIVSAARRNDLYRLIRHEHVQGNLADLIFGSYSRIFDCPPPTAPHIQETGSLIIGAVAQTKSLIPFVWKDRRFFLTVPPSYIRYWEITRGIQAQVAELVAPLGFGVEFARVPQKALAVMSGLAAYGRNNISYVPGLGSAFLLVSYYSDRPCSEDTWLPPALMERCRRCRACLRACPTGAIREEAFPVRQDRCLTFYSGYSGPQMLPAWLDPRWIECLVGCERCQASCPENRLHFRAASEEEGFSFEETEILLENRRPRDLPLSLLEKLERLGLVEFFGEKECTQMLARKLAIFVHGVEAGTYPAEPPPALDKPQ